MSVSQLIGLTESNPVICVLTLAYWGKISPSTMPLSLVLGGLPKDPLFTLAFTMDNSKLLCRVDLGKVYLNLI